MYTIIVQSPCYQSLQSVPESIGCKVLNWEINYEDDKPRFDTNDLEKLISNKTKAIYLNAPHNPTGYLFTIKEFPLQNNVIE